MLLSMIQIGMIQVRVVAFGVLKDALGPHTAEVALREGATVSDLVAHLSLNYPYAMLRGIAVSVNAEYAAATHVLSHGDEVGLLPPVSGGAPPGTANAQEGFQPRSDIVTNLTREPIDADKLIAEAKQSEDGAVVVFDGIVRNNSRGRRTLYLDYEAYEEMALSQMCELAQKARTSFAVRHVTIVHRLGRLEVGETSVLIVVASSHRAQAFDACRWLIDTLKTTVPIWKKETFVDGAVWAAGEPFPAELGLEANDAP
jgi:molybdopterin synthase catalytic subunit/molybdopterin converting factor small subunit